MLQLVLLNCIAVLHR